MTKITDFKDSPYLNNTQRLLFMDGLRGIAVILVFLYHAYSDEWAEALPYGAKYDDFFMFRFGEYGVQLFFLISGFVIAMTLEKCLTFGGFMLRRWLRLFPAMLIGTILISIFSIFLNKRPFGAPVLSDIIPGLTFIQPEFFGLIFGREQGVLEPSFWSLFVEMKFYVVSGLLYFAMGLRNTIIVLTLMFFSSVLFSVTKSILPLNLVGPLGLFFKYSDWQHYGWFAAGALFYQYYMVKGWKYWLAGVLIGLISARGLAGFMEGSMIFATGLVLLFAFSLNNTFIQTILSNRLFLFFGFISYPFYIIHVASLVSMIQQLEQLMPWAPHWMLPILPIVFLILIAWIVASYLEPEARKLIKRVLQISMDRKVST